MPNRKSVAFSKELDTQTQAPLVVTEVIRRMWGGAQAKLIRCNDGCLYILKCHANPQGPNILANEWIGSIIAKGLGISVPAAKQVTICKESLAKFPMLRVELRDSTMKVAKGLHFGSQMVGDEVGARRPTDYRPRYIEQLCENKLDFLKIQLLDWWADNLDTRQCLTVASNYNGLFETTFFDHGHMFGGPFWAIDNDQEKMRQKLRYSLEKTRWQHEAVDEVVTSMENLIPELIDVATNTLPGEWFAGNLTSLVAVQLRRLRFLRAILHCEGYLGDCLGMGEDGSRSAFELCDTRMG